MKSEPAFPCVVEDNFGGTYPFKGMDLRDYMAGQALLAMAMRLTGKNGSMRCLSDEELAVSAYSIADFMVKERDK